MKWKHKENTIKNQHSQENHIETYQIQGISQECPQCKKQFKTRKTIISYVSRQHNESSEDIKHYCKKCNYSTSVEESLKSIYA